MEALFWTDKFHSLLPNTHDFQRVYAIASLSISCNSYMLIYYPSRNNTTPRILPILRLGGFSYQYNVEESVIIMSEEEQIGMELTV